MMRGMFAAISGLKSHQVMLDVTANDIANVNTIGYKSARTTFKDSLNQVQRGASGAGGGAGGANAAQIGLGVQLGSIDNLMQGGSLQSTGNPLDVAIQQGAGFFRVSTSTATPPTPGTNFEYTRAGNFTTNSDGYLLTQDGYYVQGQDAGGTASLIQIPDDASNIAIAQNGEVSYVDTAGTRAVGRLPDAGHVRQRGRPRAQRLQPLAADRQLGRPERLDPWPRRRLHHAGLAGDVQRGPRPDVHEHDHRPARLPGQLPRHLAPSDEMLQDLVNLKR